jgi:uncharacterized membrane protein YhaH (DUF805 family)
MNTNMTPVDWAKRPLQKYADFTGRASRAEYWWYILGLIIVAVVLSIVESLVGVKGMVIGIYGPLTALLWLATIVPSTAVGARRLHDTNRSGWWQLLAYGPYLILMLIRPAAGSALGAVALAGIVSLIALVARSSCWCSCVLQERRAKTVSDPARWEKARTRSPPNRRELPLRARVAS